MLFPEKCYNLEEKCHICLKFLVISGKFFLYLEKTIYPEKIFHPQNGTLTENFLATGRGHKKKIIKCPFCFEKCPSEPGSPNFSKLPTPLSSSSVSCTTVLRWTSIIWFLALYLVELILECWGFLP